MEQWKWIPGYVLRYAVSDQGRVFSFYRKGRFLRPGRMPSGHVSVALGRGNSRCVHELVLLAFVGPPPPGMEARHLNGIPNDNRLANLEWNTRSVNSYDKKHHGADGQLSIDRVIDIKQALALKANRRKLAKEYGVSVSTIHAIACGQNHAEVPTWPSL